MQQANSALQSRKTAATTHYFIQQQKFTLYPDFGMNQLDFMLASLIYNYIQGI